MIWLLLILFVPGGKNQEGDASRSYIEVHPCDSNDIIATMWPPIPGENPKYELEMPALRPGLNVLLKFDSPLILPDCEPDVIVSSRGNNTVYIDANVFYYYSSRLTCNITIPMNSLTIPYVQSIVLDEKKQLCENPKNNYFDHLVVHLEKRRMLAVIEDIFGQPLPLSNIKEEKSNVPDIASTTMSNELEQKRNMLDLVSMEENRRMLAVYEDIFGQPPPLSNIKEEKSNVPDIASTTMSNELEQKRNMLDLVSTEENRRMLAVYEDIFGSLPPLSNIKEEKPSLGQNCGRQKVLDTALIVHGQASKAAHWPWHVALYRIEKRSFHYICGGTLLSKTMVVTAGHCASIRGGAITPELLRVDLGMHELFERDNGQQQREVFKVILHPGFDVLTLDNDIALLKMKSEVIFTNYVQPACLWYEQAIYKFNPMFIFGTVAGWGFDHQDSPSNILQQITIPLVSDFTCLRSNPTFFNSQLKGKKFCAGFGNGTAVCNGDSGGGLMIFVPETPGGSTAGAWHVRGIVSVAPSIKERNVCDPDQFTIFTDVKKYRDWVLGYLD